MIVIFSFLLLLRIEFCRPWCYLECCKTEKRIDSSCFWTWGCWTSCESLLSSNADDLFDISLFGITTAALLFLVKIYIYIHTHMILWFCVIRLLKGLELRVLQGLSVLIWMQRDLMKVLWYLVLSKSDDIVWNAWLAGFSFISFLCSFSLFLSTAKKFGVTEFVNPKDHDKPVHEVGLH